MRESGVKYLARMIEKNNQPGEVGGLRVGIFQHREGGVEEPIGEYHRNYQVLFDTFSPFQIGGADYALYSPQYHVTRPLSLPSCQDIGGEAPQVPRLLPD